MKAILHGTLDDSTGEFQSPVILPNPPPKRFYRPMIDAHPPLLDPTPEDYESLNFRTDHYSLAGVQDGCAHYHYVKSTCV